MAPKVTPPVPLKETIEIPPLAAPMEKVPALATLLLAIVPLPDNAKVPPLMVVVPL